MFERFKYKNGLQAIISPLESTKAVTVLVMVRVGSRNEKKSINGIAHFTEHLMFKGTKRRPNTLAISKELDAIGADYNAFTSKEYTGYYIKVNSSHLNIAIDMLSDMMLNSKFDTGEIEKEKGVIVEEINMYEDAPMMMIDDLFDKLAYQDSQLAWEVLGSPKTVNDMKRNNFLGFKNDFYNPNNMLISIAGDIKNSEEVSKLIEKYFIKNSKKNKNNNYQKYILNQSGPQVFIKKKDTKQVHLALGYVNNINYQSNDLLPLKLASIAFGGNMSSRLFINIREKRGLCYYIRSRVNTFQDVGNFSVQAGLDKDRIDLAISLIIKEMKKLSDQGITVSELKKAGEYFKGKMILALEDSANIAQWYAEKWLFAKKLNTPEDIIKKIDSITLTEVNKVLKKIIRKNYLNLALIGDFNDAERFKKLIK